MKSPEETLLARFVVENPELEQLEALLAEFNIFEALGAVRQELRHFYSGHESTVDCFPLQ